MTCPVPGCQSLPDCKPFMCSRCQEADAGELAAKHTAGKPVEAWKAERDAILLARQPGQKAMGLR